MASQPDSDAPAPASDDLAPDDGQLSHDEAMGLAHAHATAAHEHLGHALGYMADDDYDPSEPRGMERFRALSAERRHAVTGDGAMRSFQAMRGR